MIIASRFPGRRVSGMAFSNVPMPAVIPGKRSPSQPFLLRGSPQDFTVSDFWSTAYSDLLSNMNRGTLAEFLVLHALSLSGKVMNDFDEVDARLPSGLKLEVKSSAYLQRWRQSKPSTIRFSIEKKKRFDYTLNDWAPEPPARHADIYCFALYCCAKKGEADPMVLDDWRFYCVSTALINELKAEAKTIGLAELHRLFRPKECGYEDLANEVHWLEAQIKRGAGQPQDAKPSVAE